MKKLDKKTITVAALVILALGITLFISIYAVPRVLVTLTKAAPATKVSIASSYLIGEKILAKANGKDENIVNVFVMDINGKGVEGRLVNVGSSMGTADKDAVVSGKDGKASFKISSNEEGQSEVRASIEGAPLNRTLKVTFRN